MQSVILSHGKGVYSGNFGSALSRRLQLLRKGGEAEWMPINSSLPGRIPGSMHGTTLCIVHLLRIMVAKNLSGLRQCNNASR